MLSSSQASGNENRLYPVWAPPPATRPDKFSGCALVGGGCVHPVVLSHVQHRQGH